MLVVPASASNVISTGTCGEKLTWKLDDDGTLKIYGTGAMDDFTYFVSYGEAGSGFMWCNIPWYRSMTAEELPWNLTEGYTPMDIETVILADGVSSIGGLAFLFCDKLSELEIPLSISAIGSGAFHGCNNLTDVYYSGSREQWNAIDIAHEDNDELFNAKVHFGSTLSAISGFSDVPSDAYYADAVEWAVNHNPEITNGIGSNRFGSELTVTRGQAMTFLWRMNGKPEPKISDNPFQDVNENDYFYKAVLWAVSEKITNGTSATTFSPELTCNHAYVITYLWRMAGRPGDTESKGWYDDAVSWANEIGLYEGTAISFFPTDDCPRADIVTYLYRFETSNG